MAPCFRDWWVGQLETERIEEEARKVDVQREDFISTLISSINSTQNIVPEVNAVLASKVCSSKSDLESRFKQGSLISQFNIS
jgi:hypothetical protein